MPPPANLVIGYIDDWSYPYNYLVPTVQDHVVFENATTDRDCMITFSNSATFDTSILRIFAGDIESCKIQQRCSTDYVVAEFLEDGNVQERRIRPTPLRPHTIEVTNSVTLSESQAFETSV